MRLEGLYHTCDPAHRVLQAFFDWPRSWRFWPKVFWVFFIKSVSDLHRGNDSKVGVWADDFSFSFFKVTFLRVQSATMRDLEEDDSVESLKAKNQKVSKSLKIREEDTCCARCQRCWGRSRRSRRKPKSLVDLPGTWGRPWLSPSSNRCYRGSREGEWRNWWQSFGNVLLLLCLSPFAHLSLSEANTLEFFFQKSNDDKCIKEKNKFFFANQIYTNMI